MRSSRGRPPGATGPDGRPPKAYDRRLRDAQVGSLGGPGEEPWGEILDAEWTRGDRAIRERGARGEPCRRPSRALHSRLPSAFLRSLPERRYPVVFVLTGFTGRGRMLLNDNP